MLSAIMAKTKVPNCFWNPLFFKAKKDCGAVVVMMFLMSEQEDRFGLEQTVARIGSIEIEVPL